MADLDALRYRHDELRRALDIQRDTVDTFHGRANVILIATLGASAFLGVDVAPRAGIGGVILGVVGIAATTILFAVILRPRKWGWFAQSAQLADPALNHPGVDLEAMLVAAIDALGRCAAHNAPRIHTLAKLIIYQGLVAAGTVTLWLILAIP